MKILYRCLLAALLLVPLCGRAQSTFTIRGKAIDTVNLQDLRKASVVLLRASDSVLETFTRTASDGTFELHPDSAGSYILSIVYPDFAGYTDKIAVPASGTLELGEIAMVTRTKLLSEFVFQRNRGSIKVNGDTVEYVADSFQVRDNATVEDLLKKLPGITVDKNGKITAQGEQVQKLLVDGEEFFSDDPAVVTKSLQSKAVESVQVYDKKSDQAIFTGIEDGEKTKTINLKLKENRKQGYFGKLVAGGGTDGFYENQAMFNSFKGKRQLSAFGILSNTANIGLGWEDARKYGSSSNSMQYDEESGNFFSFGENGSYSGEGLPWVATGGLHYANKWNEGKEHLSGNYRYSRQEITAEGSTLTQYILPDSQYFSDERRRSTNLTERHRADGLFDWTIDTMSSIKLTVNAGTTHSKSFSGFNTRTFSGATDINRNIRDNNGEMDTRSQEASLIYRKRFAKKGRSIAADVNQSYSADDGESRLFSVNQFFAGSAIFGTDTINQRKTRNTSSLSVNGNLTYTEPITKNLFAELRYGLRLQNNQSEQLSYNPNSGGENFTVLDSLYSSNYDFDYQTHTGGAFLRYNAKKFKVSLGGSAARTQFDQNDLLRDTAFHRNFTNFFPKATLNYEFTKMKSLYLSYDGATNQPTISQIQPLRQNNDPLNIAEGNPNLRQEFRHTINLRYNSYSVMKDQWVYAGSGMTFTQDDISRRDSIGAGVRKYQYVNVDGNYNGWVYGGFGGKIKPLNMRASINTNINLSHSNSYVNGRLNTSDNNSYSFSLNLSKDKEKKYDVSIGPKVSYNDNKSSISTQALSYWQGGLDASATVQLPGKVEVNSNIDWSLRQRTGEFDRNNSVFLWNAYASRKFLKGDQLELRLQVYDILNQNLGFRRFANVTTVTENRYNTIRRYGMLSLIWNFTHTGNSAPAPDAGAIIIDAD